MDLDDMNCIDLDGDDPYYIVTWVNKAAEPCYARSSVLNDMKTLYNIIDDRYGAELWLINPHDDVPLILSSRKAIPSERWED